MEVTKITAAYLDGNDAAESTQYANKPIDPKEWKLVVNETFIQKVNRTPISIQDWRNAHINADDRYYPNRRWLYDIYDDCSLDGHTKGIIAKRFDTILNKTLHFKKDGKPDKSFKKLIGSREFRLVCRTILETILWGISGIEFEPGPKFAPRLIPRKHIKPKWQIISFLQNGSEGIDYTSAKNILVTGEPEDLGLLLSCIPYIIYKRNAFGDWSQYIEIFGQPVRVMYYDATDQQAKIELKRTLDDSGGALALMIPKGVEFELKDGKVTNGDGKLQSNFIENLNRELSVIILGNTETTTNGQTGTGAKSKVHKDQQDEISKSDIFYLKSYLNSDQFLQILESYGYKVEGGEFEFDQEISIEYLKERMSIDAQLPEDLPISDDYWYETYGVEKPSNYDELKKKLEDKQKALKAVDDIENDPQNKPAKKPANPQPTKKQAKEARKILETYQAARGSGKRNLLQRMLDFFAQAGRGR